MASVSTWADEVRSRETAAWHYVNPPDGSCSYEPARDCPGGNCVVEAINGQVAILKSRASDAERLVALKWVVHLVGDVHQPLHAGFKGDKGGNRYQVQAFGRGMNLHSLWDGGLIRNRVGGTDALPAIRCRDVRYGGAEASSRGQLGGRVLQDRADYRLLSRGQVHRAALCRSMGPHSGEPNQERWLTATLNEVLR